jgi:hypothetical protein
MITKRPDNSDVISRHKNVALDIAEKGMMRRDESKMTL